MDEVPPVEEDIPGETIIVYDTAEVVRARDALTQGLRKEGYARHEREGDAEVFKHSVPWHPQVLVHDDGWIEFRNQPPRIHSPGKSFADQGSLLNYLWCVPTLMTACVSPGTWIVSRNKVNEVKGDTLDAIRGQTLSFGDAVMRARLQGRLYDEVPKLLAKTWADTSVPAADRRRALFQFWDSRVEGEAGDRVRAAVEAFMIAVVQASKEPYGAEELATLNASRRGARALQLRHR
jgi:hypothetical protein